MGSAVPPAHPPHPEAESGAYSRDSSHFPRRRAYIPSTAIGSVPRLTGHALLRTDGVHCRESAATGPIVLKVVPVTGAAFAGHHGPTNVRLLFPTPTNGTIQWYITDARGTTKKKKNTAIDDDHSIGLAKLMSEGSGGVVARSVSSAF